LDLNAARHRFSGKSATGIVSMLNMGVPVLELLEPARSLRPVNALNEGAYAFDRIENTRQARQARDFLLQRGAPPSAGIAAPLQKDLAAVRLRLIDCHQIKDQNEWLDSLVNVARAVNPYLAPAQAEAVWARLAGSPCHDGLHDIQRRWIALFRAVAMREALSMGRMAEDLLAMHKGLDVEHREYLLAAAMSGHIAAGAPQRANAMWDRYSPGLPRPRILGPVFRLLRCHAMRQGCAAAFTVPPG